MSSEDGFVTQVVAALSRALTPLVDATTSPEALAELLAQLGWGVTPSSDVVSAVARANPALEELGADVAADAPAVTLVADVAAAMAALAELEDVSLGGANAPFDDPDFWRALPGELFALLVDEDLARHKPGLYGVLRVLGVLRVEARSAEAGRLAYDARVIDLGALGRAAADPSNWLTDVYGWGTQFDHAQFLRALAALGAGLGGGAGRQSPHPDLVAPYIAPDNPDRGTLELLSLSPFEVGSPTLATLVKPALLALPLPPAGAPSEPPEGLLLWPIVSGAAAATVDLGPAADLTLDGDFQATPVRIQLGPGGSIVEGSATDLATSARVDIAPATPFVMAGTAGGTRIELTQAHFGVGVNGTEVVIDAALDEASAVLDLAGADSFLRGVLGSGKESLSVAAGLSWSSASGVAFSGSALPSVRIPTDIRIAGVLSVTEILVVLAGGDAGAVVLTVSVKGGFELGPFSAVAEDLGLRVTAAPATFDAPGNFGLLDVSFGFKPPDRVGFTITSEAVNGGGFVGIDVENGRYSGGLALDFSGGVGLGAIVIVDTEIPGDPDGWALFASIFATFPSLPLGFGFFLSGVGGLVCLNRTMDGEALASGLKSGAIDAILFPDDPLEDAPQILSQLDAWFPLADGSTVIGVAARITWGTPVTIVTGQLGIALVLPELEIAVMGSVAMLLPTEDEVLLELHMDSLGVIDIPGGTVMVVASLYDSALLSTIHLSGDMAFYVSVGAAPYFLLSVGGYHPSFDPPCGLPAPVLALDRMRAEVAISDDVLFALETYVAVTANTLQFGSLATLVASAKFLLTTYTARGSVGFDVLLVFSPFSFSAAFQLSVSVSAGKKELLAVDLAARLDGPAPWYTSGYARFEFFGIGVRFDFEFGGPVQPETPERTDVCDLVVEALDAPAAWRAAQPAWVDTTVLVFAADEDTDELWVRPDAELEARQTVAPLDRALDHFGVFEIDGPTTLAVTSAGFDGVAEGDGFVAITDWFAPAQYDELTRAEKLAAPSYEEMTTGVRFGAGGLGFDAAEATTVVPDYEVHILDEDETRELEIQAVSHPLAALALDGARQRPPRTVTSATFAVGAPTWQTFDPATATTAGSARSYRAEQLALAAARAADPASRLRLAPTHAAEAVA